MKPTIRALIVSFSLLLAAPAFAVTAIGGGVAAGTNVQVGVDNDNDSSSTSQVGVPVGTLTADVTSSVVTGNVTTSAFSKVVANWTSANAGSAVFDWGWNSTDLPGVSGLLQTNKVYDDGWNYSFLTGASGGVFNMSWVSTVTGSSFGIQGLYGAGGLPFNVTPSNLSGNNGSGSFSVNLGANTNYTFKIANFGNIGGLGSTAASNVKLDWNIVDGAVPEPATWAMMIFGFGLIGSAMRSRRARGTLAFS